MRTNRIYEIRLIVAGSRTFHDYKLAKEKLDRIVFGLQEDYPGAHIVIISGDAKELTRLASGTPWNENCHSADSQRSGINMGKWQDQCVMPR